MPFSEGVPATLESGEIDQQHVNALFDFYFREGKSTLSETAQAFNGQPKAAADEACEMQKERSQRKQDDASM